MCADSTVTNYCGCGTRLECKTNVSGGDKGGGIPSATCEAGVDSQSWQSG